MRIYPRHELVAQRALDLEKVCAIVASVGGEGATTTARTEKRRNTPADARVLRMIPVCAEGVGGTIPGTEPCTAVIALEQRAIRHGVAA